MVLSMRPPIVVAESGLPVMFGSQFDKILKVSNGGTSYRSLK